MLLLAAVPVLAGLLIATIGCLGLRERLPRNRYFGVRTAASLRDEETFRLANKVAGLPALVGGLVGIVAGGVGPLMPDTGGLIVAVLIGLVGLLAITVGGGALGHRAALAVPEPAPQVPSGCGACADHTTIEGRPEACPRSRACQLDLQTMPEPFHGRTLN